MSDLKREKELAEKRKNDPALNQSQDHLVRKLFSKFRKTNTSCDMSALVPLRDPERGDSSPVISRNNSVTTLSPPRLPEPSENGQSNTGTGKQANSSILNVNKSTNKVNSELTTLSETSEKPPTKPRSLCNGPRGWGRLKAKTGGESQTTENTPPPTIPDQVSSTETPASGSDPKASPPRPMFNIPVLSLSSDSEAVCPETNSGPVLPAAQSPEYCQMTANLMDFKVRTNYIINPLLTSSSHSFIHISINNSELQSNALHSKCTE